MSFLKWRSAGTRLEREREATIATTPESVLEFLTPDLISSLANLHGVPPAVAQATIQLLPFGSRSALETLGLAGGCDRPGRRYLELTPLAFEVMALAADSLEGGPETLDSLSEQAEDALKAVEGKRDGNL